MEAFIRHTTTMKQVLWLPDLFDQFLQYITQPNCSSSNI